MSLQKIWDWADVASIGLMVDLWGSGGGRKRVRDFEQGLKKFWHMRRHHQLIANKLREAFNAGIVEGLRQAKKTGQPAEVSEDSSSES